MAPRRLREPWQSLFEALDRELAGPSELHCFVGFVVAEHYGLVRATADVDVLDSRGTDLATVARLAGKGSPLHLQHKVYVDVVTVADVPDDYDTRLIDRCQWAHAPSSQGVRAPRLGAREAGEKH